MPSALIPSPLCIYDPPCGVDVGRPRAGRCAARARCKVGPPRPMGDDVVNRSLLCLRCGCRGDLSTNTTHVTMAAEAAAKKRSARRA